jgi:hemolysin-activating ACP:hemolysin acyltransferase
VPTVQPETFLYKGPQVYDINGNDRPEYEQHILANTTWLMAHADYYSGWNPSALCRLIIPPLKLRQIVMVVANDQPISFITWGGFDAGTMRQVAAGERTLSADDWNAGTEYWLMDFCCPFGHLTAVARLLQKKLIWDYEQRGFAGLKYWRRDHKGRIWNTVNFNNRLHDGRPRL